MKLTNAPKGIIEKGERRQLIKRSEANEHARLLADDTFKPKTAAVAGADAPPPVPEVLSVKIEPATKKKVVTKKKATKR